MTTFLFTDIESSTRLWEEHPEAMRAALARHDALLRQAIGGATGEVVKITGDGLLAVFNSPTDALSGALAAQLSLGSEPWDLPEPIRVRMGIHSGEGESRDGDWFGPAVNRAARIMSAGHGGQVLASGAVAHTAAMPAEASLRDLGTHRLKDLTLPEQLHQLLHPALKADFPAPTTLESRPNNLPMQVSEFFGRDSELEAIGLMLDAPTTRLLTLAGPGGAGKTRLGLQVAAEHMNDFKDGVFFVDLAPETDPDSAYEAIVRALDLPAGGGHPLEVLRTKLRDRQTLIVLDNFEQITEAAPGVAELIQGCPDLKILVTSREALRIRAERLFPVPPLEVPHPDAEVESIASTEAVQLFAERARSVRPDFAVTADNAGTIAEIVLRLDGLPLAIELAAARLNVFSTDELMERLRGRLDVLGAGGRDLPARQRTLWAAIAWSYELLSETECRVFEMMTVFSPTGIAPIEAVAADLTDGGPVLDAIASLVDKSLIRRIEGDGSPRFSMLQTIREYGLERLAASDGFEASVRQAHGDYYSDFSQRIATQLKGSERGTALDQLTSEIGNLRTAWRHWVDAADLERILLHVDTLWTLHDAKGWYHAAIELARDALDVLSATETSPEQAAEELRLRTSLARTLMAVQGFNQEVEQAFRRVLDMTEAGTTGVRRVPVLRALASYYSLAADPASALEIGQELLALGEEAGDAGITAEAHRIIGVSLGGLGEIDLGLTHLEKSIAIFGSVDRVDGRLRAGPSPDVSALVPTGMFRWLRGDLGVAVEHLDEALAVARRLDHPFTIAFALWHRGLLAVYRSRFDEGLRMAHELKNVASEHQYQVWETLSSVLDGVCSSGLGEVAEGLAKTEAAVDLYRGLTTPPVFWPLILALRSFVYAMAGDPQRGLELLDEALGSGPAVDNPFVPQFLVIRGDLLAGLGEAEDAEAAYREAARLGGDIKLDLVVLQADMGLVVLNRRSGRDPDGSAALADHLDRFSADPDEAVVLAARALLVE